MSKEITGALFKQMILHGAAAITAQKQAIKKKQNAEVSVL